MPTAKGCPKCLKIASNGILPSSATKCKACGGELATVSYSTPGLFWVGILLFLATVLLALYPLMASTETNQKMFWWWWSAQMTMQFIGGFMMIVGAHRMKKDILAGLSEAGRK